MNKNFIYFIAGGVIVFFLMKKDKKDTKAGTPVKPEDKPEEQKPDDVVSVDDVVKNSRNFEFAYEEEKNAFNKGYDQQYPLGSAPKDGDLLIITWKIGKDQPYYRKSTFQYFDRYWRRFANVRPKPRQQKTATTELVAIS
jgi:hypothetical protein